MVKIPGFHCRGGLGSIPGWGTDIPRAAWHGPPQKKKKWVLNFTKYFSAKTEVNHMIFSFSSINVVNFIN